MRVSVSSEPSGLLDGHQTVWKEVGSYLLCVNIPHVAEEEEEAAARDSGVRTTPLPLRPVNPCFLFSVVPHYYFFAVIYFGVNDVFIL